MFASIIISIGLSVTIALSFSVFSDQNEYAQNIIQNTSNIGNNILYIMGNAQTMVKPDVTLSLSVKTTNKTANEVLVANSQAMNNTFEAFRIAGVIFSPSLGLKVIGVKSLIVEGFNGFPPSPPPQLFLAKEAVAAAASEAGPPTPIIAGEQEVTSRINIVFLIG